MISFSIFCHKFLFVFHFLVIHCIQPYSSISLLVLSLFASNFCPLMVEVISVFLLDLQGSLFFLPFYSTVHLVLVLNDCGPFVVNHLFLRNWQMPLYWRSLEALLDTLQIWISRLAELLGFIARRCHVGRAKCLLPLIRRTTLSV